MGIILGILYTFGLISMFILLFAEIFGSGNKNRRR